MNGNIEMEATRDKLIETPLVRIERQVIAQDRIESFSYNKGVSPEPPGGKHNIPTVFYFQLLFNYQCFSIIFFFNFCEYRCLAAAEKLYDEKKKTTISEKVLDWYVPVSRLATHLLMEKRLPC